jgi:calcineurin-like phosphoesterase family protein
LNRTLFTADTHFMQERTRDFSGRPFKDIYEMTRAMIRNWNEIVGINDTVYHLGDFGDYDINGELKGNVILLVGNYERKDFKEKEINAEVLKRKYGFKDVITDDKMTVDIYGHKFDLVHEPSHRNPDVFTLFGHIHKLQMVKRNALNVGVDCHNFTPVTFEEVMQWKNGIQNFHDNEVFMQ